MTPRQTAEVRDMGGVTPRRLAVLLTIIRLRNSGLPCTVRGIADVHGTSHVSVKKHLDCLRKDGLIAWEEGHCGTIRPLVQYIPIQTFDRRTDATL